MTTLTQKSTAANRGAYAAPMAEMARKQRHYAASASLRMRSPDGKSMRQS